MNEIGIARTVIVRVRKTRPDGKKALVPKLGEDGQPEKKMVCATVWRVTREPLDGSFGRDRGRKLAVGLIATDLLALRPYGTRQEITIPLSEVYRIAIKRKADIAHMAKLRERKVKKQIQREARSIERAERRLVCRKK